jgi:hypothetical protein
LTTVPTAGESDQFTPVLLDPVTVGIIVADCPPLKEALVGDTEMETVGAGGTNDIDAVAFLVASAALVAVTVTVCAEVMVAGAV